MGMFDTIEFKCAKCGNTIEVQTKSGSCQLEVYKADKVPVSVAVGAPRINICGQCGRVWRLRKFVEPTVSLELYPHSCDDDLEEDIHGW